MSNLTRSTGAHTVLAITPAIPPEKKSKTKLPNLLGQGFSVIEEFSFYYFLSRTIKFTIMEDSFQFQVKRQRMPILEYMQNLNEEQLAALSIQTLEKLPSDRNQSDIFILTYATQNIGFFKDLTKKHSPDIHSRLCAKLTLDRGYKNRYVFEKGDVGKKFYVILKGKVGIYLPFLQADNRTQFEEVNQLGPGSFFGELALLTNKPRGASVKCLEDCIFGVIDRESFNSILFKIQAKEIQKQIIFLSQLNLFQNFTKQTLRTLIYHFKVHSFSKGQIIFNEHDQADCFYIIKQGEVTLSKFFQTTDFQQSDLYLASRSRRSIKVAQIGQNEIFGEIECIDGTKRHLSAMCSSVNCQLYSIGSEDFLKRVVQQNKNEEVSQFLEKYIQDKIEWRNHRITQILNTIQLEKHQQKMKDNSQQQIDIENRLATYRHSNLGELYDNQDLEYVVSKKLDVIQQHNSIKDKPISLIAQYTQSPYLSKILRRRIEDSTRRQQSESDTFSHICTRSSPVSTPSKRFILKQRSEYQSSGKEETWMRKYQPQSKFQQVQFLMTSKDFSASFVSTVKQETSIDKDFYRRLVMKSKLKSSWKQNEKFKLKSEGLERDINLTIGEGPIPQRQRLKTIS